MKNEKLKSVQMGNKLYYALDNLFKSKLFTKNIKDHLYMMLIRSIVI